MEHILIIDTTIKQLSVSLVNTGSNSVSCDYLDLAEENNHARKINVAIQKLLLDANIKVENLVAIAINEGPGSFTGLRVGSSTAKGLCFALDIPMISINGLNAYGQCLSEMKQNEEASDVFVLINARRGNYYYSHFNCKYSDGNAMFANIETIETKAKLCHKAIVYYLDEDNYLNLSAKDLRKITLRKWSEKQFENIHSFEPKYIVNNYIIKR